MASLHSGVSDTEDLQAKESRNSRNLMLKTSKKWLISGRAADA